MEDSQVQLGPDANKTTLEQEKMPRLRPGMVRNGYVLVEFEAFLEIDGDICELWVADGASGRERVPFDPEVGAGSEDEETRRRQAGYPSDQSGGRGYGPAEVVRDLGRVMFPAFRRD